MAEKSGSPAAAAAATSQEQAQQQQQFLSSFITEIVKSPVNLALVGVIAILVYKIVKGRTRPEEPVQEVKKLPKLRRDFAIEELTKYDGKGPDGRILVAVNGSVYDVTRGSKFYGPGGPYEAFGGRDASRALARFAVDAATDKYDDLSDLNTTEMNSIKEWEEQFKERYDYVGKLLKPGEAPTNYSDEEDEGSQQEKLNYSDSCLSTDFAFCITLSPNYVCVRFTRWYTRSSGLIAQDAADPDSAIGIHVRSHRSRERETFRDGKPASPRQVGIRAIGRHDETAPRKRSGPPRRLSRLSRYARRDISRGVPAASRPRPIARVSPPVT